MLTERDMLEQYKRQKDNREPTDTEDISWGDAAGGFNPLEATLWKSTGSEIWEAAKGLPQLPIFMASLIHEIHFGPQNFIMDHFPVSEAQRYGTMEILSKPFPEVRKRYEARREAKYLQELHKLYLDRSAVSELDLEKLDPKQYPMLTTFTSSYKSIYGHTKGLENEFAKRYFEAGLSRLSELDLDNLSPKAYPMLSAFVGDYKRKYGSIKGLKYTLKNNPAEFLSDVAMFIHPFFIGLRVLKGGKYARIAMQGMKVMDFIDPGNVPTHVIGGGFRALARILPPARKPTTISEQFGLDKEGNPEKTDITAAEAAEKYGAGEEATILSVLSDSDELASRESAIAFDEKPGEFDPVLYTSDTVSGVLERLALTKHVGDEKINARLRELADEAGIPHEHLKDPTAAGKVIFESVLREAEQGDIAKRAALAKYVSDMEGQVLSHYESGVLVRDAVKEQYATQTKAFEDAFLENNELKGTEITDIEDGVLDQPDSIDAADIPGIAAGGVDLDPNIAGILPVTQQKLKELVKEQGHTRALLSNPDLEAVSQIINKWFTSETADKIKASTERTGKGLTVGDFIRLRTNYFDTVNVEVQRGNISPVGAGRLKSLFFGTISEDLNNLVTRLEEAGEISEEAAQHYRNTNAEYRAQMELQETGTAKWIERVEEFPENIVPSILTMNPEQLAVIKKLAGEKRFVEQQPNIMNHILENARDKDGYITSKGIKDQIGKMQYALDDLLGEHAGKLNEILSEVERVEKVSGLRETEAWKFILKNVDQPANIFYELTKKKGIFNPEQIKHLKEIMKPVRWEQLKASLLGHIFQQAAVTSGSKLNPGGLSKVINNMTDRDQNRLVDIFGREQAKELREQAAFWERHHRLSGWNKNSNTAFHQNARRWLTGATAASLMQDIIYWIQIRGVNPQTLNAADYASMTLLVGSFGGPYLWKRFIKSENGRNFLQGGGIPVPGTAGVHITAESLDRMADFMVKHQFVLGHAAHKTQQAREEAERRRKRQQEITKQRSSWRGGYERFLVE